MGYFKHPTAVVESDDIGENTKIWHFVHVREGAKIGRNCTIGKSVYIDADVEIGNGVKIQNFATLYKGVAIEDEVFIGPAVTFTNDKYPRAFLWDETQIVPTVVKRGASIGANATIICGVVVGAYAMVGAGALITKDVPDHGLVLGNPAELRGFVCRCGRPLLLEKRSERSVSLHCARCDEVFEVDSELYESAIE
jgi:UDP-2-acetamido-3-amino-2,3-dideoxy-glucuronate N-acetyltransferase